MGADLRGGFKGSGCFAFGELGAYVGIRDVWGLGAA